MIFTVRQILKQVFFNESVFELNILRLVTFWIKTHFKCEISYRKFFEKKTDSERKVTSKKIGFDSVYSVKTTNSTVLCLFTSMTFQAQFSIEIRF